MIILTKWILKSFEKFIEEIKKSAASAITNWKYRYWFEIKLKFLDHEKGKKLEKCMQAENKSEDR